MYGERGQQARLTAIPGKTRTARRRGAENGLHRPRPVVPRPRRSILSAVRTLLLPPRRLGLLVLVLLCVPASVTAAPQDEVTQVEVGPPVPLVVWNREIVALRGYVGRMTTEDRARQAAERVLELPETALFAEVEVEPIQLGTMEGISFTVAGRFLFALLSADLDPGHPESLDTVGERTRARLAEVLRARAAQRELPLILRGVGLTVVASLVLAGVLWLIALGKRAAVRRFRKRAAHSERLRLRDYDLRTYVAGAFERLAGLVHLLLAGAALYGWLGYCLALFPYTAPWGERLGAYLVGLLKGMLQAVAGALPDLVIVAVIFFVTRGVARTVSAIVQRVERRAEREEGVAPESVRATRRLAVVGVWILGLVLAYPYLPGSDSDAFKGISVLIGLMVSLGSSGFINQVMSGFAVLYSRSIRSGELVRIGDVEGQVLDVGLLSTRVLEPGGAEVSIPNAVVVGQAITNFSSRPGSGRAVASATVTIGYDTPWRQVRALLLLAAQRTEGIAPDPAPRVVQRALGDWYAEYALYFEVEDGKRRPAVLSRLHGAIQDAFNEFGVQIMSPHFERQPDSPVVVPPGGEAPDPVPRFASAAESAPAAFDPREQAGRAREQRARGREKDQSRE